MRHPRIASHRSCTFVVLAALLAATSDQAGAQSSPVVPATLPQRDGLAERAVAAIVRNEAGRSDGELVAALTALGEAAIAPCFARVVGLNAGAEEEPAGASEFARLALLALPEPAVTAFLLEACAGAPDLEARLAVLRGAGRLARASSLQVARAAILGLDPLLVGHPVVAGTLRGATAAVLAEEPQALRAVEPLLLELPTPFAEALLAAVDAECVEEAGRFMLRLLGKRPELDPLLIARLDAAPPRDRREHDACASALRDRCRATEPAVRRAAAHWLRRDSSVATARLLTESLEDSDERVVEVAHRSLTELSGVLLACAPDAWEEWLDSESEWLRGEGAVRLELLESGDDARQLDALATLSRKRLHANAFAAPIGALLRHPRHEVRIAACEALGRLNSLSCREELSAALADTDPRIAARAAALLHRNGAKS